MIQARATFTGGGLSVVIPAAGYPCQNPAIAYSRGFAQAGYVQDGFTAFSSQPIPSPLSTNPVTGIWNHMVCDTEQLRSPTISELIDYSRQSLKQWKQYPDTHFNYARFVLDVEAACDPTLSRAQLERDWQDIVTTCNSFVSPNDLFEQVCFQEPANYTFPLTDNKIEQLRTQAGRRYLMLYREKSRGMSDFINNRGGNCSGRMKFMVSLLCALQLKLPKHQSLGIQVFSRHVEPVIYDRKSRTLWQLNKGKKTKKIRASIYDPALLFHAFLKKHGGQSPVTEEQLLIRQGDSDPKGNVLDRLSNFLWKSVNSNPVSSNDPFCFPSTNISSSLLPFNLPVAIQSALPTNALPRFVALAGLMTMLCGLVLGGTAVADHPLFYDDFDAVTEDQCQAELQRDRNHVNRGRSADLEISRLGFSFFNKRFYSRFDIGLVVTITGAYDFMLCTTEDEHDHYQSLDLEEKYDFMLKRLQRYQKGLEFQNALLFLTTPQTAILEMEPNRLKDALELIKWLESHLDNMDSSIRVVVENKPNNYSGIKTDLSARSSEWSRFFGNIGKFRQWVHDNPLDFLVYLNAVPSVAKKSLLDLISKHEMKPFLKEMHTNVSTASDESQATSYSPSRGPNLYTPDIVQIEVDEVWDIDSDELAHIEDKAAQPEQPMEQERSVGIKISSDTAVSIFRRAHDRFNIMDPFFSLVKSGFWSAAMSQHFLEKHSGENGVDRHDLFFLGDVLRIQRGQHEIPERFKPLPEHMEPLREFFCQKEQTIQVGGFSCLCSSETNQI